LTAPYAVYQITVTKAVVNGMLWHPDGHDEFNVVRQIH